MGERTVCRFIERLLIDIEDSAEVGDHLLVGISVHRVTFSSSAQRGGEKKGDSGIDSGFGICMVCKGKTREQVI